MAGMVVAAVLLGACGGDTPAATVDSPTAAMPAPEATPAAASPAFLPTPIPTPVSAPSPTPAATLVPTQSPTPAAFVGGTDDITWQIVEHLGEIPSTETMVDLGLLVAHVLAPDEGEGPQHISIVDGPTVGDLGEIAVEVVGLADDSVLGYRLRVFAHPVESGGFALKSVERTLLCRRGVSGGLCL